MGWSIQLEMGYYSDYEILLLTYVGNWWGAVYFLGKEGVGLGRYHFLVQLDGPPMIIITLDRKGA